MPDLPRLRAFLPAAFDAVERGDLDVREAEDGAYFVVRVDQITPPQLRPLDEVRAAAINTWKATERATFVAKQANTLADSLKDGADFQNLARDANASVEVSPPLTRDGLGGASKLSPLVLANLFRIDVGRAAVGATAAGDGQIVARLVRVEAADPAADTAQRASQRQSIAATIAEDLVTQFRAQLEARIGVTIDRAVLEAATF
jgi:peptidyl-prolyl cis-trans isomerase D